ncbi:MAG: phosphoribosylanthranilate isomerase [Clostridiales bacterium]|nr:phosphoribosylanthranilate isomerase [Clostridiales bacterium]
MAKIKICGLTRLEDIAFANELKPDYVGFVFAESRRKVSAEDAMELRNALVSSIPAVGVFVDQDMDWIASLVGKGIIQIAQLHGNETEEEIRYLKKKCGCPVIRAVRVNGEASILEAQVLPADYLLLDSGAGSGKTFSWEHIPKKLSKPYFLAGGINAENARKAIQETEAFALDASSSVETDGVKDREKMKELIRRIRTYER